jgi:4-hydroxy-4-methyl-2-oxoglutarate aldolase
MNELNLVAELGKFGTPTLAEASPEVVALSPTIAPLFRPIQLAGVVYPIQLGPRDNLAAHFAVAEASSGSVLVIATGRETRVGFWGEVLTEAALARGIRGLVTDGAVRDVRAIRDRSFPVFCSGVAIPGTAKNSTGLSNEPITMGDVMIRPGDLILGDDDGVVVVRRDAAVGVLEKAKARSAKEIAFIKRLRDGELTIDLFDLRGKRATKSR